MASGEPVTAPSDSQELFDILPTDIDELRKEAESLYEEHYEEVALNKGVMRLDVDWKQYYMAEEQDRLASLAAWAGHRMIGYSVSQVCHHLHYRQMKFMANDVIFLSKAHRASGLGLQLIDATIHLARGLECEIITFHAKPGSAMARMLGSAGAEMDEEQGKVPSKLGFIVQDIVFSKVL